MDILQAMRAYIAIAEHGSLTAAAHALHGSLPSMVRTLAALERHVGVRLINRTTRRIALTEEGRRYLARCRDIVAAVESAESELGTNAIQPTGTIVVTAPVLFGRLHVAPVLARYVKHYPAVRAHLLLLDRVANLIDEGIDIGIRVGPLSDSSLIARHIGEVRHVVVASPAYLETHGTPRHPADLVSADCVLVHSSDHETWVFQDGRKQLRTDVEGRLIFNQAAPAIDTCVAGMGYGRFFSYQVAHHIAEGTLRIVLEKYEPPRKPVSIVYPNRELLPAKTRMLIDWFKAELPAGSALA